MQHPKAVQSYIRPGVVRRQAVCPTHEKKTSDFIGPQWVDSRTLWRFRCRQADGHYFFALPDRTAPRTAETAKEWEKQQEIQAAGLQQAYDAGGRTE